MVTLIPEQPDFNDSTAEEVVWNALRRQLPDGVTIIHGQRLTGDDKDVEIDFLILWPRIGIAVIEVKGGRVDVVDGKWFTSGAQGKRSRLSEPPLEQAMIAKHTLVEYLRPRLSRVPGPISHLAVLPYTELPTSWDQPDAPRRQLVDGTEIDSLASKIADQLRFDFDPERHDLTAGHEFVLKNLRRTNQAVENFALKASEISPIGPMPSAVNRRSSFASSATRIAPRSAVVLDRARPISLCSKPRR